MAHDQNSESAYRITKRKGEKLEVGKSIKKSKHCRASKAKWSPEEDEILSRAVMVSGEGNWKKIAQSLNDRSHLQCLHRWQKVLNPALVKGPWKEEEDAKLTELVEKYGPKDWSTIASHIPGRIGKQCRERWFNHLSPDVRKTNWSPEEDRIIIEAHSKIGNKWTNISKLLEGRPANAIKNHWNSTLLKRIQDSTGETTPRRDRSRNKKQVPMRATEFDFRTQQRRRQWDDQSSDGNSPQQYQQSPVSSPELPYQEPTTMVNTVRFQYPTQDGGAHVFFNPFNDHHASVQPAPNSYTSAAWDSWPAPNVIHLTPSTSSLLQSVPIVSHNNVNHSSNTANLVHNMVQNFSVSYPHTQHNSNNSNNNSNNNNNNSQNGVYDVEYGLGLTEASPEEFMDMYTPVVQTNTNTSLPVELQYCFDHPQQVESLGASGLPLTEPYNSLSMENTNTHSSSSMINNMGMMNMNMNNIGLLSLDMPGFCPLDL